MKHFLKIAAAAAALLSAAVAGAWATAPQVFTTWQGDEIDKLASVWLIRRHIAPDAVIRYVPPGTAVETGTVFDVPGCQLARTFKESTYEALLRHYGIKDEALAAIGRLVHDVEINTWGEKQFPQTARMVMFFTRLYQTEQDPEALRKKAAAYFDALYDDLKRNGAAP